ncbi:MAG TPA: chromosome segregation SMC family protein [Candidatus Paceibacterota bacterium]|nr:chromosome segregation SMC family protein [Candidatus Paceibacterota bacterium]
MYLKELTISGFKSFAKKGELEFSAPITAIVGPNGSGKSNVAESFRFVLGEQSVKSMRGKRGEDLIWGGSTQVARGNRAAVSILLDNTNRVFPLDFSEIKIERVVHRDGQNEYILNGSSVRLKDIQELLASANIGSTGHHIISQGEADRILTANAKERREMIEDALGLKIYQYKRLEAERKLTKTTENVAQVESLRREVAPHLKYLEKQVQKIEKSLALQEQLKSVYAEYLCREDRYIASHHDRLLAERHGPEIALKKAQHDLAAAKKTLQDSEAENDSKPLISAQEAVQTALAERQMAERELSKCEGQIALLERRLVELERRRATPAGRTIHYAEMTALVSDIEQQVSKALQKKETSFLERALSDIVHRLKLFVERATEKTDDSSDFDKKELERLQTEVAKLSKRVTVTKEVEDQARETYAAIEQRRVQEATDGREAERAVFRLVGEQRDLEAKLERIDRELSVLDRDRNEFKRELQEAVALLGRAASDYFNHIIKDEEGNEVSQEALITEDREKQRARRHELEKLKIRLEELGIGATDDIIKEYNDTKERDAFLAHEIADLETSIAQLRELITELQGKLEEQFVVGIKKISIEFNRFFTLMFGGGEAELVTVTTKTKASDDEADVEMEEDEKPKEDGIELSVKLPNKRVKGLEMLSGGERALTSIALIFAMSQVNPPPFIILDETDAALDEANSRRYGDMIEALAKKSQLILITHNRETMSRAGVLYGVTMGGDGISKLLSVKFDEALAVAK